MARSAARSLLRTPAEPCGPVEFGPALAGDDEAIRALLRAQPMDGRVRATLEREPDARLAAGIEGDRHHTVVARERASGRVVGMGSRAVRRVWIAGEPARMGYLGQLRRDPALRARMRLLGAGFRAMERTRLPDEQSFDLTAVIADNSPARRLLERGLEGFPIYRPLCELTSLTMPVRRRVRGLRERVRRATPEMLPAVVDCLQRNLRHRPFAPVWTVDDLQNARRSRDLDVSDFHVIVENSRVVACLALWDQRRFKQVVIHGYGGALRYARPPVDVVSKLRGLPRLPRPGAVMSQAYLSHVAVDDDDPGRMNDLVAAACRSAARRGIEYLVTGMSSRHPSLASVRERFGGRAYTSTLYLVHRAGDRAPSRALGTGLPHVEVATL